MQLDQNPVFRRIIAPWYDSTTACWVVLALMALVFVFSTVGIAVAQKTIEFRGHLWLPMILLLLSGSVMVSTLFRLLKRRSRRGPR
ncbi:hypothetical protein D3OALGA1CA_5363 [Olavius algarvensis associated proteobacterium Delta 3]|nr:hypothetical protein D3OALGB2SA_1510 [Olavius algarvensis associated proteobacterium Delta 3]CAB5165634.1 hypothetical protein D3OALGA1CA_5363 [Olavius algarvensis associated proteobacterium Delta 3]